jgi:glutathione S-transferase
MPEDGPVLYGRHASRFVRRVAVTLRLYGIGYRHEPLMPFGPDKAKLAQFNPIARVPALQLADGEMLIDSAVILDFLDGLAGPDRALTPVAGRARRRVLTLLAVATSAAFEFKAGMRGSPGISFLPQSGHPRTHALPVHRLKPVQSPEKLNGDQLHEHCRSQQNDPHGREPVHPLELEGR